MPNSAKFEILLAARDMTARTMDRFEQRLRRMTTAVFTLEGAFVAAAGATALGKMLFDTGKEIEQINLALEEITGSSYAAAREQTYLRQVTEDLGQSYYALLDPYKKMIAAAKGTVLEGQALRDVFFGINQAAATLGLSSEQVKGTLQAIEQMISKGTVQTEELRGQLGERLPGAFNLAAQAMGVSTEELNKMLEKGEVLATDLLPKLARLLTEKYTRGASRATRASNSLADAWKDLKAKMASDDFMDSVSGSLLDMAETMKDPEFLEGLKVFADTLAMAGSGAAKIAKLAAETAKLSDDVFNVAKGYREFAESYAKIMQVLRGERDWRTGEWKPGFEPRLSGDQVPDDIYPTDTGPGPGATPKSVPWIHPDDEALFGLPALAEFDRMFKERLNRIIEHRDTILSTEAYRLDQSPYGDDMIAYADPESDMVREQAYFDRLKESAEKTGQDLEDLSRHTAEAMQDAFADFFFDAFQGKLDDLGDYVNSFITAMQRTTAQKLAQMFTQNATGDDGWFTRAGNAIAQWLGGSKTANARGNIYSGAGIGAYKNQVVGGPTLFRFAHGIGLMGEAGYEAIMPLARTPSGDLGVKTTANPGALNVVINNHTPADIDVQEKQSADGHRMLYVSVAGNIASGGSISKALESRYGIMPQGRRV